nr:hypothetical protein [Corynebacterium diphtheriae]
MQAFIRANHEYESAEATFLILGLVSDEMTALALISALQQSSTGLCRFVVSEGQIQAKASLLVGEFLTAARLQAWWRRSLDEVEQWYAQALAYSIISSSNTTSVPAHLQPQGDVLDIFSDVASPDAQKCESVTAERVAMCMARLTGVMPETRMAGNSQVVETSIGGQSLDIEAAENELRFTIGSSLNNQNPALSTALAQTINQHDANEDRMILCRHIKKSRGEATTANQLLTRTRKRLGLPFLKQNAILKGVELIFVER